MASIWSEKRRENFRVRIRFSFVEDRGSGGRLNGDHHCDHRRRPTTVVAMVQAAAMVATVEWWRGGYSLGAGRWQGLANGFDFWRFFNLLKQIKLKKPKLLFCH